MTFLAPAWAAGLLAAALPLAAHLLGRWGGRPVVFPAARFVREAEAESRRLWRPRHVGLLALRTVALVLVVLAFMQPVWRTAALAAVPDDALGRHVAIILDRTASMQRTERGHILFEQARHRAITTLRSLNPPSDRASIVLLDRETQSLLPEPTANIASLIDRLQQVTSTYEHGRVSDAIARVRMLHQRLPEPDRRVLNIELLTDVQHTQWPDIINDPAINSHAALRVHRIGSFRPNNALHAPTITPRQPIAGQPARVSVRVNRFADDAIERTVELRAGELRKTRRVTLEPLTEQVIDFEVTFADSGAAVIDLRFADGDDALPADDATGRVVHVRSHRQAHLLTEADHADPVTASFFVRRALAPDDEDADRAISAGVKLDTHTPDALAAVASDNEDGPPRVLVLVEAGALTSEQLEALYHHLDTGGGAIWIVDSPAAVEALQRFGQLASYAPIVPRRDMTNMISAWETDSRRALGAGAFEDPILSVFEGTTRTALLRQTFTATLRGEASNDAEVLLRFDDGEPALAVRSVGAGRLAVLAADLGPNATDFAKGPMLVPLLHQVLRHLTPGAPAPANPHPGDPLPPLDGQTPETTGRVQEPGLHATYDEVSGELIDGVWYELDPRESDLRPLDVDDVDAQHSTVNMGGSDDEGAARAMREVSLWPWMMLAALVTLLIEPVVLRWMGERG